MANNDLLQGRPKWIILNGGNPYVINVQHPDMLRIMGGLEDVSNEVDHLQTIVSNLADQVTEIDHNQQQMFSDLISLTNRVDNLEASMSGSSLTNIHNTQIIYNPDRTVQKIYYRDLQNVLLRYSYNFVYDQFKVTQYTLEVYDNGNLFKKYIVTITYDADNKVIAENLSEII